MATPFTYLLVFIGAGLGGVAREAVTLLSVRLVGPNFPWGTLSINVSGSALMGILVGFFAARNIPSNELRLFLMTGVLGGYTTFSTFSLDSVTLWEKGESLGAIGYVAGSLVLSVVALAAAMAAARHWA